MSSNEKNDNKKLIRISPNALAQQSMLHLNTYRTAAKDLLISTDHVFTDTLSRFAGYVDSGGDAASSPAGMKVQINKRIKAGYGVERKDMTGMMRLHCALCFSLLAEAMQSGMERQRLRSEIKRDIWRIIDAFVGEWQTLSRNFKQILEG